jgi:hypothetical protein
LPTHGFGCALPIVRLLWSILAARLLHVLATANVTGFGRRVQDMSTRAEASGRRSKAAKERRRGGLAPVSAGTIGISWSQRVQRARWRTGRGSRRGWIGPRGAGFGRLVASRAGGLPPGERCGRASKPSIADAGGRPAARESRSDGVGMSSRGHDVSILGGSVTALG